MFQGITKEVSQRQKSGRSERSFLSLFSSGKNVIGNSLNYFIKMVGVERFYLSPATIFWKKYF
jgi:hypothetical protein